MNSQEKNSLTVMTWNIYQGADLIPLFSNIPVPLPNRIADVFRQFLATNFPERAKAIARQIAIERPDIIGLQEAVLIELIPPNTHNVVYDFVDILLKELSSRGLEYSVAAKNENFSTILPSTFGNKISFLDRDVILIRKDCSIKVIDKMESHFVNNSKVDIGGLSFIILRGWSYIDVRVHGHKFRLLNTHLEPVDTGVQVDQGNELLSGPAVTTLPLIFIGDYNSNANGGSGGTATYGNLIAAGFKDAWLMAGIGDGSSCCQDADLLNAGSLLNERIDLILVKNWVNLNVIKVQLVGEVQSDKTKALLWPSDHAGVVAKFKL